MAKVARALALALIASLMGLGVGLSAPAGAVEAKPEVHPEWGRTAAKNGVLKFGCRNYRYTYALTPPEGEWGLETFLVGPGGERLASGAIVIGMDELVGKDRFRFCKPSTRPGIFKIRALLTVQDEQGEHRRSGWLPVTKFRLRAAR